MGTELTAEQFADQYAAFHWPVSNAEYHLDATRISHSRLELFRDDRPAYRAIHVERTMQRPEQTDAMLLGSALHCRLLEPDKYTELFAVAPKCDRRTTVGKLAYQAAIDAAGDASLLKQEQSLLVEGAFAAAMKHDVSADLLGEVGECEHSICWRDEATGIALKARLDKLLLTSGIILDLKFTTNPAPEAFAKQINTMGYHRQGDLYKRGVRACYGADLPFVLIAIQNEPPFAIGAYELSESAVDLGRLQNNRDLEQFAECQRTNNWFDFWEKDIRQISLPDYVHRPNPYGA